MKTFTIKENSWLAKIAAKKLKSDNVAMVLGNCIHIYGVSKEEFLSNKRWLKHELKHVQQYEENGYFLFIIKYLWHSFFHGYHNCCYEKEARTAENDDSLLAQYKYKNQAIG